MCVCVCDLVQFEGRFNEQSVSYKLGGCSHGDMLCNSSQFDLC